MPDPGYLISAPGPYRARIKALTAKYPSLGSFDWRRPVNANLPPGLRLSERYGKGRVAVLELHKEGAQRVDLQGERSVQNYLQAERAAVRRIFVIEAFDPELVSCFGQHFDIDPQIFMEHERPIRFERFAQSPSKAPLASLRYSSDAFTLEYWDLRVLKGDFNHERLKTTDGLRSVALTWTRIGDLELDIARVHQKVSYVGRRYDDEGWDAIILVDPPIGRMIDAAGEIREVSNEPYQGGYPDFIKHESLDACEAAPDPTTETKTSMLEGLCFYWLHYSHLIELKEDPRVATMFLQKIIASNCSILFEYLHVRLQLLSFQLTRFEHYNVTPFELAGDTWSQLQAFDRDVDYYDSALNHTILALGVNGAPASPPEDWKSSTQDFKQLKDELQRLAARCKSTLSSYTSFAGFLANYQSSRASQQSLEASKLSIDVGYMSLQEAKAVKSLTWLATLVLPLSYVSSIFSMSGDYAPGNGLFWVYFVVALPLALLALVSLAMYNFGINRFYNAQRRTREDVITLPGSI